MGRNVSTESSNDTVLGIVRSISAGTITTNDLVFNNKSGYISAASAYTPISKLNNNQTVPYILKAFASIGYSHIMAPNVSILYSRMCELGNGNIAIVYTGDNSASTTVNVQIQIFNQSGDPVVNLTNISTDSSIGGIKISKLNSTQFIVAWSILYSLKFIILNNDGTVAVAATTVSASLKGNSYEYWNFTVTTNNNIVFAYIKATSSDLVFSRYNSSGVLQGTETVIDAGANSSFFSLYACANGNFIVYYKRTVATVARKFARYNSSGVLQGSIVTLVTSTSQITNGILESGVTELSNGNMVFISESPTTTDPDIYIYNSANVLVKSIDLGVAGAAAIPIGFATGEFPCLTALPNGGFAVTGRRQYGGACFCTYDSSGNSVIQLKSVTGVTGGNVSANGICTKTIYSAEIGFIVAKFDVETYTYCTLFILNDAGELEGTPVIIQPSSVYVYNGDMLLLSSGIVVLQGRISSSAMGMGMYHPVKRSVLGVALDSVTYGQTPRIATKGNFTINQNIIGTQYEDTRTNTAPGAKATIIGNQVILGGL